jgi:hypothetical protein
LLANGETHPVRFLDTLNRTLYGNVLRMGTDKNLTLALLDYAAGEVRLSGHVRWLDGTPGPAIALEDIDFTTVDWHFVLTAMHTAL